MRLWACFSAAWLLSLALVATVSATAVDSVGMTVRDTDRAASFYTQVLGFEKVSEVEVAGPEYEHLEGVFGLRMRVTRLCLGSEYLVLTQYLTPRGHAFPDDSRANDRWFQHVAIVVSDMNRAYQHLRENHIEYASTGPQTLPAWNRAAAGISAFYFRDPDGHFLEVINFPAGKGDPRWQQSDGKLFLGIDHSAIVVGDSDASIGFYQRLGFFVAGTSENYGTEQEHLNNVFGAHLRITTLRSDAGPGVELLEYLAPRDGRPAPTDGHPNDILFWNVALKDLPPLALKPGAADATSTPNHELGFSRAALVRDPDGHTVELTQ